MAGIGLVSSEKERTYMWVLKKKKGGGGYETDREGKKGERQKMSEAE